MTRKAVIVMLFALIMIAIMIMPGSAMLVGDAVSSVTLQTNGLLSTGTNVNLFTSGETQAHHVGYAERTFATGSNSVYMRDLQVELPAVAGSVATVFVDRTFGFNLDGAGSGTASSYEAGSLDIAGMLCADCCGNDSQVVCDSTEVYSRFFAADALAVASQTNLIGNVLPATVGVPGATIGYNIEAMGTNVGISSIGARGISMGGIGNTTELGAVVSFNEKFTMNKDFMLEYTFSRDIVCRPPPQEFSPPSMCVFG